VWGAFSPTFALSTSESTKGETYRAYSLERRERYLQGRGEMAWATTTGSRCAWARSGSAAPRASTASCRPATRTTLPARPHASWGRASPAPATVPGWNPSGTP
jgi:hypothetical protein